MPTTTEKATHQRKRHRLRFIFRIIFDPCEFPLSDLEFTYYELVAMLKLRSLSPGTIILDRETKEQFTVTIGAGGFLALSPPCERITRHDNSVRKSITRRRSAQPCEPARGAVR